MGGDSLIRIFLTNLTSITKIQTPVSLRKSFGQPRFFQRHYVAVWSLEETVDLNFAQFSPPLTEVYQAGLCGFSESCFSQGFCFPWLTLVTGGQVFPTKLLKLFRVTELNKTQSNLIERLGSIEFGRRTQSNQKVLWEFDCVRFPNPIELRRILKRLFSIQEQQRIGWNEQ